MTDSKCGPGSSPSLHSNVRTYCQQAVLSAEFIPSSDDVRPFVALIVLVHEVRDRCYGQVLSQMRSEEFPELPYVEHRMVTTPDLEFESVDSHDPLSILHDTLVGLERISDRVWSDGSDPILNTVTVTDDDYSEVGMDIVNQYGTPYTDLIGFISKDRRFNASSDLGYCEQDVREEIHQAVQELNVVVQ